jgi:hypothetical protein
MWFSFVELRRPRLSDQCALSSSFAFLQSVAQHNLVRQPQPTNSSHGLLFPSAHEDSAIHFTRACLTRYVPPAGFGYPLDGLLPPRPRRFCFTPAALLGFTLRSFPISKGIRPFPSRRAHMPFLPPIFPPPRRWAGPTVRGFWALTLLRVPGGLTGFNSPTAGCSLGFYPLRVFRRQPGPSFHSGSSHAL